jgi:PAB-dependent poly(A)-specific ribonuclease subunit 2
VLIQSPLNLVGMPYYSEPLLSNFAPTDYAPVTSPFFNPPEPVPPNVLSAMKVIDFVGYATLPRDLRGKRYVVNARPGAGKLATGRGFVNGRRESAPRFRSDKDRKRDLSVEPEEEVSEVTERCFSR